MRDMTRREMLALSGGVLASGALMPVFGANAFASDSASGGIPSTILTRNTGVVYSGNVNGREAKLDSGDVHTLVCVMNGVPGEDNTSWSRHNTRSVAAYATSGFSERQIAAALWFSYGFPGYGTRNDIWPDTDIFGAPMSERIYMETHRVLCYAVKGISSDESASGSPVWNFYQVTDDRNKAREWANAWKEKFATGANSVFRKMISHVDEVPDEFTPVIVLANKSGEQDYITYVMKAKTGFLRIHKRLAI